MTPVTGRSAAPRGSDGSHADANAAGGVPLGRWHGVPVRADWSAVVALVLFGWVLAASILPAAVPHRSAAAYWVVGPATALAFLGTLLVHELAHALTARHFGLRVRGLTLWLLGGYTELGDEPTTPRAEACVAAAGPLANLAIGITVGAVAVLVGSGSLVGAALGWLAEASVLLGVFNLLPGAPLDGGRVLRAAFWWRWKDRERATGASVQAGRLLGAAMIGAGLLAMIAGAFGGLWLGLVGWYVVVGATAQAVAVPPGSLRSLRAADVMAPTPVVAADWWTVRQFVDGLTPTALAQPVFPLVDFGGAVTGHLTGRDLGRIGAGRRDATRLREVNGALRVTTTVVTADDALADVAERLGRGVAVVVDDHGVPVGAITPAELRHAVELVALGWHPRTTHAV